MLLREFLLNVVRKHYVPTPLIRPDENDGRKKRVHPLETVTGMFWNKKLMRVCLQRMETDM